jgi:hypothetical protein
MFDQFWQQYPQGSILSDLVQIHKDLYVVKVTLSSSGQPLVATLAAADRLETAESMARERAMQILGCEEAVVALPPETISVPEVRLETISQPEPISTSVPAIAAQPSCPEPLGMRIDQENSVVVEPDNLETIADPLTTAIEPDELPVASEQIDDESAPLPSTNLSMESLSSNGSTPAHLEMVTVAPMLPASEVSPTPQISEESMVTTPAKTRSKKAPAPPVESPPATPNDDAAPLSVTDIIPLINMELKRLNWSREQGRDYMVSLYNKRASSLLSDEELFGLLQHLQDEPGEGVAIN